MKLSKSGPNSHAFLFASLLGAGVLYFFITLIYELERMRAGESTSLQIGGGQFFVHTLSGHWLGLILWIVISGSVLWWRGRLLQTVHEKEELLHRILETAADAIYLVDSGGRITFANAAAERALGLSRAQIAQHTYHDAAWKMTTINGEPFPEEDQPFVRVMKTGEPVFNVEQCIEQPDGSRRIFAINAAPLHDAVGKIVGEVGAMIDITERKRAEEQLKLMSRAIEHSPASVVITDASGAIQYVNPKFSQLTGYTLEEAIGNNPRILKTGHTSPEEYQKLWSNITSGREWSGEFLNKKKNGDLYWESAVISPMMDASGAVTHFVAVKEDITERKRVEEVLHESEDRFRELYERAPIAYYSVNADDGHIHIANQRAAEMFGCSQEDLIGRPIFDFYADTPSGKDKAHQIFERFRAGEEINGEELQIQRADGELIWISLSVRAEQDTSGKIVRSRAIALDISERKRAEWALAEERHLLRTVIDHIPYEIFIKGLDGRYIINNRVHANLLGVANPADAQGKTASNFYPPDVAAEYDKDDFRIMQSGEPMFNQERQSKIVANEQHWRLVSKVPLRDTSGDIIGLVGISQDITERKRAEQALQDSEERYRAVALYAYDAIVTADADGNIAGWNRGAERIFGYAEVEVSELPLSMLVPQRYRDLHNEGIKRVQLGGEHHVIGKTVELTGLHKDGHEFPMELSLAEWKIGENQNYTGIIRDITDRKHTEEALRQAEEKYRGIFENAVVGIYQTSCDGKWLTVNPTLARILGYDSPAELVKHMTDLAREFYVDPSQRGEFRRWLEDHDSIAGFESQVYRRDGSIIWIVENARAAYDAQGTCVGFEGTMVDITDRRQAEQLKNEFVSVVSHELRTPLTSIRGSLGLIAGGAAGAVSPQAKMLVDIAHKNSERLVRLINDILDIEKIESGKMVFNIKPIELAPVVEQSLEANAAYANEYGVRLTFENRLPGVQVNADSDRLIQVVTNLLSNAAKFSPPGGTVDVSIERHGSNVRVAIQDHGPGIPLKFRNHIFQKFAQADSSDTRQKSGTGLGLNICKTIIERLHGQIGFETVPETGTTFYFDLPEWRDEPAASPVDAPKARILICEDEPDTAALLKLVLEQAGLSVDVTYTAGQAKELLKRNHYAGMTLDIVLPDQDGVSLLRELRADPVTRDLPIVVVSMRADQARHELNGDALHVIDWISKPIDQTRLLSAVRGATLAGTNSRMRILHVEDDADIIQVVSAILRDFQVDYASTLSQAQTRLLDTRYDLVILDLEMPDGIGTNLIPFLNEHHLNIPVVIFSIEEVQREMAAQVAAALVKSRTSNEKFIETIRALIQPHLARDPVNAAKAGK